MKAKGLYKLLKRIELGIRYEHLMKKPIWKLFLKEDFKLPSYTVKNLEDDIKKLKEFRAKGIDIWQRDFFNLDMHESISACASPLSTKLRSIQYNIDTRITTKYKRPTQHTQGHTDVYAGGQFIGYIMPDRICGGYTFTSKHDNYPHMSEHSRKGILAKISGKASMLVEF